MDHNDPTRATPNIGDFLLGTGMKIAFAATHFHGFGVAPQGPWITWMNKGSSACTHLVSSGMVRGRHNPPYPTTGRREPLTFREFHFHGVHE
jgi:hypothetical protein